MKTCRTIDALLYLYRDGELSANDKTTVDEHVRSCLRCREILEDLLSMDKALLPLREHAPQGGLDMAAMTETLRQCSEQAAGAVTGGDAATLLDALSGYLRPALSVGLIAAALLFITQESRDALTVAGLERRLQSHGDIIATETQHRDDQASLESFIASKPAAATLGGDPSAFFGASLAELFRHSPGLFEELARRYPNLSSITLDNGLDERERAILETEGKAFMKEFEQLTRKGER